MSFLASGQQDDDRQYVRAEFQYRNDGTMSINFPFHKPSFIESEADVYTECIFSE